MREGGRKNGREGRREGVREGGKNGREGRREGGIEGGIERGIEGGTDVKKVNLSSSGGKSDSRKEINPASNQRNQEKQLLDIILDSQHR